MYKCLRDTKPYKKKKNHSRINEKEKITIINIQCKPKKKITPTYYKRKLHSSIHKDYRLKSSDTKTV